MVLWLSFRIKAPEEVYFFFALILISNALVVNLFTKEQK